MPSWDGQKLLSHVIQEMQHDVSWLTVSALSRTILMHRKRPHNKKTIKNNNYKGLDFQRCVSMWIYSWRRAFPLIFETKSGWEKSNHDFLCKNQILRKGNCNVAEGPEKEREMEPCGTIRTRKDFNLKRQTAKIVIMTANSRRILQNRESKIKD